MAETMHETVAKYRHDMDFLAILRSSSRIGVQVGLDCSNDAKSCGVIWAWYDFEHISSWKDVLVKHLGTTYPAQYHRLHFSLGVAYSPWGSSPDSMSPNSTFVVTISHVVAHAVNRLVADISSG